MQGQVQLALDMVCTLAGAAVLLVWQAPSLVFAFAALAAIYLRVQASMHAPPARGRTHRASLPTQAGAAGRRTSVARVMRRR
jgi:hypothetical protein